MRLMLLVPLLLVSVGLTTASLMVVRSWMQRQMAETLASDVTHSVATFQNLQNQHRQMLMQLKPAQGSGRQRLCWQIFPVLKL